MKCSTGFQCPTVMHRRFKICNCVFLFVRVCMTVRAFMTTTGGHSDTTATATFFGGEWEQQTRHTNTTSHPEKKTHQTPNHRKWFIHNLTSCLASKCFSLTHTHNHTLYIIYTAYTYIYMRYICIVNKYKKCLFSWCICHTNSQKYLQQLNAGCCSWCPAGVLCVL